MYQKCPICNGTGIDKVSAYTAKNLTCPTCKGKRIIDDITGEPPDKIAEGFAKFLRQKIKEEGWFVG